MNSLSRFKALPFLALALAVTGCAAEAPGDDTTGSSEGAVVVKSNKFDLKQYALVTGVVAMGPDARTLYEDIKANGGKDLGNFSVLAGLRGADLGINGDDADESFGIVCQAKEGDSTFRADTCSMTGVVKARGQKKRWASGIAVSLSGRLAAAVARSLPPTSPAGLVGSTSTGSGNVSCTTTSGHTPDGPPATCTVPVMGAMFTFHQAVNDEENKMKVEDAEAIIDAFY